MCPGFHQLGRMTASEIFFLRTRLRTHLFSIMTALGGDQVGIEKNNKINLIVEVDDETGATEIKTTLSNQLYDESVSDMAARLIDCSADFDKFCLALIIHGSFFNQAAHAVSKKEVDEELLPHFEMASYRNHTQKKNGKTQHLFQIRESEKRSITKSMNDKFRLLHAGDTLQRATLSAIVAEYEFIIRKVAEQVGQLDPMAIANGSETVSIGTLYSGMSAEEAISSAVMKEIDKKMSESTDRYTSWVCQAIANEFDKAIKSTEDYRVFMEGCARRNIIIHNGGIVNKRYIESCKMHKAHENLIAPLGSRVEISNDYLKRVAKAAYVIGQRIIHSLIHRLKKSDRTSSCAVLLTFSHEMLATQNPDVAKSIISVARKCEKDLSEETIAKFKVNTILCLKMSGDLKDALSAHRLTEDKEWPKDNPRFDLAIACLRRNFNNIESLAKSASRYGVRRSEILNSIVFSEAVERYDLSKFFR